MTQMPSNWKPTVMQALRRLLDGDERGFEDTLWLGLGDAWWPLRQMLVRKGLIEVQPQATYPRLTPRGEAYVRKSLRA